MTSPATTPAPRRHVWRWVALGFGICLTPFVILAIVAASFLTLDRDASALRKHVMAASAAGWHTKVQLSIGSVTLDAVRLGLLFVHDKNIADARMALAAVRHASVGVYERTSDRADWSRADLFADTDKAMQKRGWTRMVGVADHKDTVMIYVPKDFDAEGPIEICLAVVSGRELVVVSTSVNASMLADLVAKHVKEEGKPHFHLARFSF